MDTVFINGVQWWCPTQSVDEMFFCAESIDGPKLSVILLVSLVSNGFTESFSHRCVCLISPWNLNGHFTCPLPLCPYNKPKSTELSRVRHCHWTMCLYCRNLPVAVHRRRGRWLAASFLRIRYGLLGVVKIMIYNRAWCWRLRRPLQKRYLKHLPDPSTNASFSSLTI